MYIYADGKIPESKLPIASSPTSTFRRCDFSSFLLRAASSSMFKKEMKPSGRPLYTPVAVYAYRCVRNIMEVHFLVVCDYVVWCNYSMSSFMENIANFVPMPPELAAEDTSTLRGGSHVPPVLVIQIHIPGQHAGISMSSMLQQKKKDIPGVSLLVYFKLTMVCIYLIAAMSSDVAIKCDCLFFCRVFCDAYVHVFDVGLFATGSQKRVAEAVRGHCSGASVQRVVQVCLQGPDMAESHEGGWICL